MGFRKRAKDDSAEQDFFARADEKAFRKKKSEKIGAGDARRAAYQCGKGEVHDRHEEGKRAPRQGFEGNAAVFQTGGEQLLGENEQKHRQEEAGNRRVRERVELFIARPKRRKIV